MDRRILMLAGVFLAGACIALVAGVQVGLGDYRLLGLIVMSVALAWLLVRPNFPAMLAFGVVCPFTAFFIPIFGFRMSAVVVGICMVGLVVRACVKKVPVAKPASAFTAPIVVCCLYIMVRYAVTPALPGAALGLGTGVSGFRVWANYWVGMGLLFVMGRVLSSPADIRRLFRFQFILGAAFATVLLITVPISSAWLSRVLHMMAMTISFFSNGWRRILVLPGLGVLLAIPALVPECVNFSKRVRLALCGMGMLCVIAGASRGGLLSLIVFALVAMILRRRYGVVVIAVSVAATLLLSASIVYRAGVIGADTPFVRVFGLLDRKIARETDGVSNMHWRMMRWRMAREDIKSSPWFGKGYGGIANYFSMSTGVHVNPERAKAEKDVAMGQTHNGYISAARGLGIPFAAVFTLVLIRQALFHVRFVRRKGLSDPDRGLHVLLASLLIMDLQVLLTNMEFNSEMLWLHLGAGVLLERFSHQGEATQDLIPPGEGDATA